MKKLKPFMDGEGRYFVKARLFFFWFNIKIIYNSGNIRYFDIFEETTIKRFDTLAGALLIIQNYYSYKARMKKQSIHIQIDGIDSIEHAICYDELNKE